MAVDIPNGYLTRPNAAKVFNRSKRALERDLEEAYKANDENVLEAFQLVTNDRQIRQAKEVTTELVERLKQDGKNPVWCVREAWLQTKFGRKGQPKPETTAKTDTGIDDQPSPPNPGAGDREAPSDPKQANGAEPITTADPVLPDDIDFLKERIRVLEREKQREIERNEQREAKLFDQLAVKDKQISAWDEVTQGLTRGLATGQIAPALAAAQTIPDEHPKPKSAVSNASAVEDSVTSATRSVSDNSVILVQEEGTAAPKKRSASKSKSKSPTKPAAKKKTIRKPTKPVKKKRHWLTMPVSELFSRIGK
jgi:hypothetical protein